MNKKILLGEGYRRFKQGDEPTLYQKKICDEKGIKYFINCHHYIFPDHDTWDFRIQIGTKKGTINISLLNTTLNLENIELFMENTWIHYGYNYHELFVKGDKSE